ncbi:uncharacterized protein V1510DRAFT_404896 [Dipodascopsis tothii]|uniref:uncharacterized protein n=1 Tax=Dipodascopsis tothii TaxID=44089 RepID=UPI0034CF346E
MPPEKKTFGRRRTAPEGIRDGRADAYKYRVDDIKRSIGHNAKIKRQYRRTLVKMGLDPAESAALQAAAAAARDAREAAAAAAAARAADRDRRVAQRAADRRKMTKTTRKGQPSFGASMEVILGKLQRRQ